MFVKSSVSKLHFLLISFYKILEVVGFSFFSLLYVSFGFLRKGTEIRHVCVFVCVCVCVCGGGGIIDLIGKLALALLHSHIH